MKLGTITLSTEIDESRIKELMKVNSFDGLFIQYKESDLYNVKRELLFYFDGDYGVKKTEFYNIYRFKDIMVLHVNLPEDEDRAWDILDSVLTEDIDYIIGNFSNDADSNLHFELTFDFVDSYKEISHHLEQYPDFTDRVNQTRETWILSKKKHKSNHFELDKLIGGVWIDDRD